MWDDLCDRFSASDPGFIRLCGAGTTVGGVLLALLVLSAAGMPVAVLVVGAWSAMVAGYTVGDPSLRGQAVTLGLALPVSIGTLILGTMLAPHRIAADVVLLVFIFTAMYVRRYGPRGSGLGDFAFQHFFIAEFSSATFAQLPSMCVVVVVAIGCAGFVRLGVVRATPERTLRWLRRAFRARLRAVTDAMIDVARAEPGSAAADGAMLALQQRSARLHQGALMIQSRLETGVEDQNTARLVQRRIAEAEIAAERLSIALLQALRPHPDSFSTLALHLPTVSVVASVDDGDADRGGPLDPQVVRLIRELRWLRVLVARPMTAETDPAPVMVRDRLLGYDNGARLPEQTAVTVQEVYRAVGELARAMLGLRLALGTDQNGGADGPEAELFRAELVAEDQALEADEAAAEEPVGLQRPTTRAAFQVTVGSAIAIVGGELLSAQHWYWAMFTCWVVFLNTSSVGEVLVKVCRRLAGTMAGVAAGIGLVALVAGHTWTTFTMMIVCMSGAFFTASVSYLLMSLFITTMVGLLYALLGTYSDAVLVQRVEETALGAAAGLVTALLVLPARTRRRTDEQLAQVLQRMRGVIGQVVAQLTGRPCTGLLDAARELDTALDAFRISMQPLIHPASPLRTRRSRARYILGVLETCAYHARSLAATAEAASSAPSLLVDSRLTEIEHRLDDNLAVLAAFVQSNTRKRTILRNSLLTAETCFVAKRSEPGAVVITQIFRHLQRLDENILSLARLLGVACQGDAHGKTSSGLPRI
ncbi:FUSC family protein [Nocardia sp. NPDC004711]